VVKEGFTAAAAAGRGDSKERERERERRTRRRGQALLLSPALLPVSSYSSRKQAGEEGT
jgi:hypothetical protein